MKVEGRPCRSIWADEQNRVRIIDQTYLPHAFVEEWLQDLEAVAEAITSMRVRGAPLIGAAAAFGMALAARDDPSDPGLARAREQLQATRPTAVNLPWALERMMAALSSLAESDRAGAAMALAREIADEDVEANRRLGEAGLGILEDAAERAEGRPVNILTHCNAGWLATVDWGTATAPIYLAHQEGIPIHVWVDETRPRNQGSLTAWELGQEGIPHTVVVDNAGGHLMQTGRVDLCMVGTDRTTTAGDVTNKIGTYLKALAAADNGVPFYAAVPEGSIDWSLEGPEDIPIEERSGMEVEEVRGRTESGEMGSVRILPDGSPTANPGFDVTPARLVSGLITPRGVCPATREGLERLFPERG